MQWSMKQESHDFSRGECQQLDFVLIYYLDVPDNLRTPHKEKVLTDRH